MYAFNGVAPIEPNPEFFNQLAKATEGGKGVIFACEVCRECWCMWRVLVQGWQRERGATGSS